MGGNHQTYSIDKTEKMVEKSINIGSQAYKLMKSDSTRVRLFEAALKAFTINGTMDTKTTIGRQEALDAKAVLVSMKDEIVKNHPKEYCMKFRSKGNNELSATDLLTILRQLCRYHGRRLASRKVYVWDAGQKKKVRVPQYHLL